MSHDRSTSDSSDHSADTTTYIGARVIVGDGHTVLENAAITVLDGRIQRVAPADQPRQDDIDVPHGAGHTVSVHGKTIMPALVNPHGHIGYMRGTECHPRHYSRDNIIDHLRRSLYFGISTFQSLGTDLDDTEIRVRDDQRAGRLDDPDLATLFTAGAGIVAAPTTDAGSGAPFFAIDAVHPTDGPEDARTFVSSLAAKRVDAVKFWIDDRHGSAAKLRPETAVAIVDEAHRHGLKAAAHIYTADDARVALSAGADILAHMPRNPDPDDKLIQELIDRDVAVFTSMSVQGPASTDWLDEPILHEVFPEAILADFRSHLTDRGHEPLFDTSQTYARLQRTATTLHAAGVRLVLSPDTGVFAQLPGMAEHRELQALVEADIPVLHAIEFATQRSARLLGLDDRGLLEVGRRADLLILDADPRDDIRNTRKISSIVMNGRMVDRSRLRHKIRAAMG
ncbi:amidohydrolase family protein [Streptomyces sp. NPDC058847]|uniref:amidohydrolase family protein n=1 Tax=Streptomyces sp. NPDC058847 TaxID=3346649 RepID=UPI0036BA1FD3